MDPATDDEFLSAEKDLTKALQAFENASREFMRCRAYSNKVWDKQFSFLLKCQIAYPSKKMTVRF